MLPAKPAPTIVAAGLAAPAPYDCDSALERACEIIVDAGLASAHWAVFPDGFIPGYPAWVWAAPSGDDSPLDALRATALAGAVRIPSDVTDRLCRVAQRARVNVAIGVIECDDTTCYKTLLLIDTRGLLIGAYRAPLASGAPPPVWIPSREDAPADERRQASGVGGI